MTDIANKRHEIAKEIRALLMSSPAALTIDELRRDFHQFMDKPIPFRELGYSNLEDLLRDMTDVLQITYRKGMMCLEVIPDDTTRHIAKLVSKQKIPNKNKYATMRRGPPPRRQQYKVTPSLPRYIKDNISELFRSYSNGLPLTHLDTAYSKRFGSMFSFNRLGFVSIKELLYSIPECVLLKEFQGGEWRVLPVHMKAPEGNWRTRGHKPEKRTLSPQNRPPDGWSRQYDQRQAAAVVETPQQYNSTLTNRVESGRPDTTAQQKPIRGRGRGMKRSASGGDQASVGRESESSYNSNEPEIDPECCLETEPNDGTQLLQTELRDLLAEKTEGIWASQLPFLYKMKYSKLLNFKDLGYMSVIELCNSFPDQILIERPVSKGDWLLYDARVPRKSPKKERDDADKTIIEEKRKRHNSQKGADPELKEKIRQVVMCRKEGIPLKDFLAFYQKLIGDSLPVEELGFGSVERFLLSLTDTLLQFKYKGDGIIMVLPLDTTAPQRTDKLKYLPEPEEVVKSSLPEDAILPGACYRHLELPQLGEYFEVFVSNIVSPGLFWFQVRSKKTTVALEKVMNQLEYCYKTAEGNTYRIPDELLVVGLVVAAVFPEDDNYHRCIVTKLEIGHQAQVYFVDYGNTCSVHRKNLRLLRSKFLKLPIQAIQGRLGNVQPNGPEGQKWTMNARNKLLSMCINKPLVALATKEKDRVMSLVLVDTSGEEDVCYNDKLVQEGYAIFRPDDHTTNLTGPSDAPEIPDYSYVYGITDHQSSYPDTSSVTALSSHDTDVSEIKQRFVKEKQLTSEFKIHVINLDGVARVLSEEISAFLFDTDVLTGMLEQKRKKISKIEISMEEQPQVFMELQEYGAIPPSRRCISLYELNSVPQILHVFNLTSGELISSITDVIEKFDPEEAYWKGESGEEMETESIDGDYADMDQEKITLTIDTLQYKRKRILQSLMDVTISQSEEVVNELNNIETQISQLKTALEKAPKTTPPVDQFEDAESRTKKTELRSSTGKSDAATKSVLSASVSPVKMTNVVTPMKITAPPNLPKPTNSGAANLATQNPMNTFNMTPQQLFYQQMLFSQMNQQAMINPLMSQFMLGQVGSMPGAQGQPNDGQLFGLNSMSQMGNPMQGIPQMGNPMHSMSQMGNPLQNPVRQMGQPMGLQNMSDVSHNQGDVEDLPLLPGLLPLLQHLSIGRGSGDRGGNSGSQ
ncbi:tudor domain-containing protein 5-like [Mytilus trossulus]|uniref:tudor domain-containing protein 5-like n=1 Tax=Mytilus trossulus TaxID=6551 RepID=UPI003007AAE7